MRDESLKRAATKLAGYFVQSGLAAENSYFPDDDYGKKAQRFYDWSRRAYALLKRIGDEGAS